VSGRHFHGKEDVDGTLFSMDGHRPREGAAAAAANGMKREAEVTG